MIQALHFDSRSSGQQQHSLLQPQVVDNGTRRSFVVGVPRETTAATLINAAKIGRQPPVSVATSTPRTSNNGSLTSRRKSCDLIAKKNVVNTNTDRYDDEKEQEIINIDVSHSFKNSHMEKHCVSSSNHSSNNGDMLFVDNKRLLEKTI